MRQYKIDLADWNKVLEKLLIPYRMYASVRNDFGQDYELLTKELIPQILYNTPKPATPLKNFFLPVKENVTQAGNDGQPRIIIGIPNCDLEALNILDEIYLDHGFPDPFYTHKRENTLLISSDCFSKQEHCHCMAYGIHPYAVGKGDLSLALIDGKVIITLFSEKGEEFLKRLKADTWLEEADAQMLKQLQEKHAATAAAVAQAHASLPGYQKTGELIQHSPDEIWKKYAADCVSCGACAVICPTCSCFLLIDKPDFQKVKQLDACQYPGFQRVAGGEDALRIRSIRFKNRYLCKYVWKPQSFNSMACTGCGRCIEACIGKINKNELFMELTN